VAESSWPSPSVGRVVDDSQYEKLGISPGASAGVFGAFTSPQLVSGDSSGMQVKVAADRYAMVRGHVWWSGSTIFTKAIGANASGSTRTDLVVLRLSRTTWDVTVVVIAGTPGSGAPSPVQDVTTTGSFDLPLATVTVTSGAASISAGNVAYIATHLLGDGGGYQVSSVASLPFVPLGGMGQQAVLSTDGTPYAHNGTSFQPGPKAIACRATQGTVQSGWTTGTYNSITFGTEDFDWGTIHDPVTNSSRINIGLYLGLWEISGMYCAAVNSGASNHRAHFALNGTAINGALASVAMSTSGFVCVVAPPTLVVATNAADYVELQGYMVAPSGTIGTASSGETRCSFQAIHRGHQ
jgi:hypothetical protein